MSSFKKIESIRVSERVLDLVVDELELMNEDLKDKLDGWQEVFYNCREQGFVLYVDHYTEEDVNYEHTHCRVWVCQQRSSDDIMVATSNTDVGGGGQGNSFGEEPYRHAKYFRYNEEHKAAEYIIKVIKETLHINDKN